MPKERIPAATLTPFDVIVSWSRDGTVQVATTAADAGERLSRWTEEVPSGSPTDGPTKTEPGSRFDYFDGWHVDLDRQRVNELIRILRRARDQAFGRDE